MESGRRLKILISAYACEPDKGSEPGIGWNWALAYRNVGDIWVLTRSNNRPTIEAWEKENSPTNINWVWVDSHSWILKLKKHTGWLGIYAYYWLWQIIAAKEARKLEKMVGSFDWAHHITMNGFREPGRLEVLSCPLVWGPIGGLQDAPIILVKNQGLASILKETTRTIINKITKKIGQRQLRALRNRAVVLGANRESMKWIEKHRTKPSLQLLEIGAPGFNFHYKNKYTSRFEILWIGSDEARKNPEFALLAWYELRYRGYPFKITLVGLSSRRQKQIIKWSEKAEIAYINEVSFIERLPQNQLAEHYKSADQFWFTSYRDTSGTVVLEAMAYNIPCIAFDHQGAAIMLQNNRDCLVRGNSLKELLENWCKVSINLVENKLIIQYSNLALSPHFNWKLKPLVVNTAMEELISK